VRFDLLPRIDAIELSPNSPRQRFGPGGMFAGVRSEAGYFTEGSETRRFGLSGRVDQKAPLPASSCALLQRVARRAGRRSSVRALPLPAPVCRASSCALLVHSVSWKGESGVSVRTNRRRGGHPARGPAPWRCRLIASIRMTEINDGRFDSWPQILLWRDLSPGMIGGHDELGGRLPGRALCAGLTAWHGRHG
jgi:hypothetical protein